MITRVKMMKPHEPSSFGSRLDHTSGKQGSRIGAFTLFEVLIALGVFMIAVTGLVIAIDTGLQVIIQARQRAASRELLESRLAYCQADPPPEGTPRVIEARENHGVRVEESLTPFLAKDAKGAEIPGLKKLTIITKAADQTDRAEILMYQKP